jgi:hypothetical protein
LSGTLYFAVLFLARACCASQAHPLARIMQTHAVFSRRKQMSHKDYQEFRALLAQYQVEIKRMRAILEIYGTILKALEED